MTIHTTPKKLQRLQRAHGQISITTKRRPHDITGLNVLRQSGSSKAIFPRPSTPHLEAVVVNTAGGVTGGDKFEVTGHVTKGTSLSITTQAAERIYCAPRGDDGTVQNRFIVEDTAQLFWLPQETILFNGSRLNRSLHIDLGADARLLMAEALVFGRAASGETLTSCAFLDDIRITQNGQPLYLDRAQLTGDIAATMQRPAIGAGHDAMASLVFVDPQAASLLPLVRDLLPATGGASLLTDTCLVIRLLSSDSFVLRQTLLPILKLLTRNAVPKNWRL